MEILARNWLKKRIINIVTLLHPFQAKIPFKYRMKKSENQSFSDNSREFRKGTLAGNKLNYSGFDLMGRGLWFTTRF